MPVAELMAKVVGVMQDTAIKEGVVVDGVGTAQDETPWFAYSSPVYSFAVVLRDADVMPLDEDEYWEEPHKWEREHRLWVELGSPRCPERGDPPSLSWQRFLRATAESGDDDD